MLTVNRMLLTVSIPTTTPVALKFPFRLLPWILLISLPVATTMTTALRDTQLFHSFAAAAVELSNPQVVQHGRSNRLLTVERSVRDWDSDCRQSYLYQIPLNDDHDHDDHDGATTGAGAEDAPDVPLQPPTLLDKSIAARLVSPSGKTTAVIRKQTDAGETNSNSKHVLELWRGSYMIRRIALGKEHGAVICNDVTFGSPAFSPDENYMVYAAERLPVKTSSYWSEATNNAKDGAQATSTGTPLRGSQHVLGQGVAEDWGERYPQQAPLLDLFLVNLSNGRVGRILFENDKYFDKDSTLDSVSLGQAIFHPTNNHEIAFTCFDAGGMGSMSRRLGMIYCRNRPSQVYTADIGHLLERLAKEEENDNNSRDGDRPPSMPSFCVTKDFRLARSPRYISLSNGKTAIVFLGHREGFHSHDGCMGLYSMIMQEGETDQIKKEIISPMEDPSTSGPQVHGLGFPGIFTGELPVDCAIAGTNCILLNTIWGSTSRILQVDVVTGNWNLIDFEESLSSLVSSQTVLCQIQSSDERQIELVVSETSCNLPTRLWKVSIAKADLEASKMSTLKAQAAVRIAGFGSIACTAFSAVEPMYQVPLDVELVTVPTSDDDDPIQALVLLPKSVAKGSKVPLVVIPHGGPHSVSTASFVPGFSFLASRYVVMLPNYRGSLGFGQRALTSLLTRIGRNDVDDVLACTKYVIDKYSDRVDEQRVAICGGSHGGFLAAHCTSQYPGFWKAAVMRNPVTNIASMVTATDISDWCFAECMGRNLEHGATFRGPTLEETQVMYEKSPIVNVSHVETPTLIALGLADLRVPPSQGKEWYFTLRSMGVPTELLIYPKDNHALSLVGTEADHWIRIARWFRLHLE